jgi:hypothetical protein
MNHHQVNHLRFLLYPTSFAAGMSDTNVKFGNATLENFTVLEEIGSSSGGTEAEDASFGFVPASTSDVDLQYECFEVPSSISIYVVTAIKLISLPGGCFAALETGTDGAGKIGTMGATEIEGAIADELGSSA